MSRTNDTDQYTIRKIGRPYTKDYRVYFEKDGELVSPWHDIPIWHDQGQQILNMVVEIPRWTNAKFEVSKDSFLNPIKQDVKDGEIRFVHNCFPYKGYIWNYGAIPQTWEDPSHTLPVPPHSHGDDDPLDVLDISSSTHTPSPPAAPRHTTGQLVKRVKPVGVLCVLDQGETDWKILAIDVDDPRADSVDDVEDVEKEFPGLIEATRDWFRIYKLPAGKKENEMAFGGEVKGRKFAIDLIQECHEAWQKMVEGLVDGKGVAMSKQSINRARDEEIAMVPAGQDLEPAPINHSVVDEWHFVPRKATGKL